MKSFSSIEEIVKEADEYAFRKTNKKMPKSEEEKLTMNLLNRANADYIRSFVEFLEKNSVKLKDTIEYFEATVEQQLLSPEYHLLKIDSEYEVKEIIFKGVLPIDIKSKKVEIAIYRNFEYVSPWNEGTQLERVYIFKREPFFEKEEAIEIKIDEVTYKR